MFRSRDDIPECSKHDPVLWDLDSGDKKAQIEGLRICHEECPLLEQCFALAEADPPYRLSMGGVRWEGVHHTGRKRGHLMTTTNPRKRALKENKPL